MSGISDRPGFQQFISEVRTQLEQLQPDVGERVSRYESERRELENRKRGWMTSLADSQLPAAVRSDIEEAYNEASHRLSQLRALIAECETGADTIAEMATPERIAARLENLDEVLSGDNATIINMMLSQHIEGIYGNCEGEVTVRTCKLGALGGDLDFVRERSAEMGVSGDSRPASSARRRPRLAVPCDFDNEEEIDAAVFFASDPDRFAGLGSEWFEEERFQIPERLSWAQEHSKAVAEYRLESQSTMNATAEHFGKTVPTIRAALKYARDEHGIDALGKGVSESGRRTWHDLHAEEVYEYFQTPNSTMQDAVSRFGKSDTTIRKARNLGRERLGA